jgi:hypothetical protein
MPAQSWPIWRTDPAAYQPLGISLWIAIGMVAVVLPPFVGGLIAGFIYFAGLEHLSPFNEIHALAIMILSAGLFAWVGVIIGIFVCQIALKTGFAGWGTALTAGVALPTIIFCILMGTISFWGVMVFFGSIGAMHAGSLWLGLRWLVPEVFGAAA